MSSHLYIPQLLPTMVGSRVRISASSCNIGIRDANCWFDSSVLVRKFQLDLSNPFERAVALLVLFLIASHQTYVIGLSEYYDPDSRSTTNLGTYHCRVAASEDARLRPCSGFIFSPIIMMLCYAART
jgi:hypothetical protein